MKKKLVNLCAFCFKTLLLDTTTNKGQIYLIVCTLALLAVVCVSTTCFLAYHGKETPQSLTLLTGSLVGSLAAMLAKTSPTETLKASPQPSSVVVSNTSENPVPTKEDKTS